MLPLQAINIMQLPRRGHMCAHTPQGVTLGQPSDIREKPAVTFAQTVVPKLCPLSNPITTGLCVAGRSTVNDISKCQNLLGAFSDQPFASNYHARIPRWAFLFPGRTYRSSPPMAIRFAGRCRDLVALHHLHPQQDSHLRQSCQASVKHKCCPQVLGVARLPVAPPPSEGVRAFRCLYLGVNVAIAPLQDTNFIM